MLLRSKLHASALTRDSCTMEPAAYVSIAAITGALAGWMVATALAVKSRSRFRQIDADLDDLYERVEVAQKRAASRARRAEPEEDQPVLPGIADPKAKERLRALWLKRKAA